MDENPPSFECTMCGECCKHLSDEYVVILFPQDIARISACLNMDIVSFRQRYVHSDKLIVDDGLWFPIDVVRHNNGRCVFLLDNNRCSIHDFKPIQCARGPFGFFWSPSRQYHFECVRKANVPSDWTSHELDKELIDLIVNGQSKEVTYEVLHGQKVKHSGYCQGRNQEEATSVPNRLQQSQHQQSTRESKLGFPADLGMNRRSHHLLHTDRMGQLLNSGVRQHF